MRKSTFAVLLVFLLSEVNCSLKFNLPAAPYELISSKEKLCISDYSSKDGLIIGKYNIQSRYPERMSLQIMVSDRRGNKLYTRKDVRESGTFGFTSVSNSEFDVCFSNILNPGFPRTPDDVTVVELDLKTGYEAIDYSEVEKSKKLKPLELEMEKMEKMMHEIVIELDYMKEREVSLRNTNESTFERVKWFSISSIVLMFAIGLYQVYYIYIFLKKKKVI